MEIILNGIVGIVGNYGSGKTEVSINLAVNRLRAGLDVRVADLDLVNPYFRTREARIQLEALGVEVILPPEQYLHADLPVLSPVIAGMIKKTGGLTLLDVGGDDVGAMVLAALADAFKGVQVHLLQVVNPMRPQTSTIEGCLKIREDIEKAAHLKITGLIGNANLITETKPEEIYNGYEFVRQLAEKSGLPLEFITIAEEILPGVDLDRFSCPVLPIARQLAQLMGGELWADSEPGRGSTFHFTVRVEAVAGETAAGDDALTSPTAVPGLAGVTKVAAGWDHTCALLDDATLRCWGRNQVGQLGQAAPSDFSTTPIEPLGL